MTDDLVKNEMRLAAIEYLLCQLWVNSMKFAGVTEQEFAWRTDAMLANLHKQTLPGFEPLRWPTWGSGWTFGRYTTRDVGISKAAKRLKARCDGLDSPGCSVPYRALKQ
jgi:hypothetical protein